jgi:alanyl-tRNA synthetase
MVMGKTGDRREARRKLAKTVGIDIDELLKTVRPIENVFAVADHTKSIMFMLAEGVVPSNVQEGYLTRLMIRRTYRLLLELGIQEKLLDIVDAQIELWSKDFTHLKEVQNEILNILSVEQKKYVQTLDRGRRLTKRLVQEFKIKGISHLPQESLVQLYESHGLTPEFVAETVEKMGIRINIPENFYTLVAVQHVKASPKVDQETTKDLEIEFSGIPPTRTLYYEDAYIREFEAKVQKVFNNQYVVLDQTAFYPEGGGQPADNGILKFNGFKTDILAVQKIGNVIVHVVNSPVPKEGDNITGQIDWNRRISLMRHHTATHIIMGAARRVLGQHVWQAGAQKGVETSRLDISHFQRLTIDETSEIEELANETIMRILPVETSFMTRTEAERRHGFRLYQGGAVPGKEIRVVKTGDWEVQACAGTHVKNTGEIGLIKLLNTERIQDGVERITFSVGSQALKAVQKNERLLLRLSDKLDTPLEKLEATVERIAKELKQSRRERDRLIQEIVESDIKQLTELAKINVINDLKLVTQEFQTLDADRMIKTASGLIRKDSKIVVLLYGKDQKIARIVVMAGKSAIKNGVDSSEIANAAATLLGGGGSGRPDFAQGGGNRVEKLSAAIQKAEKTVRRQVKIYLKKRVKRNNTSE